MMNVNKLKELIGDSYADVAFMHNQKRCGVTSEVHDSVPTFIAWCGEEEKTYSSVDDVMSDKFYDGKSLTELVEEVEIEVW